MLVQSISLETENMMFVCLAPRHIQISLDLMMETEIFVFFLKSEGGRENKDEDGGMEGQCIQALLISFLRFLAFFSLSLPYTKALMCAAMCFAIVLCLKA